MNKNIADDWATLLESGDFTQAPQRLKRDSGYCCLGVLCELYKHRTGRGEWVEAPQSNNHYIKGVKAFKLPSEDGFTAELPQEVAKWAGIRTASGSAKGVSLTSLNDQGFNGGIKTSFKEIAQFIRENVEDL